jgi:hypothetical protein
LEALHHGTIRRILNIQWHQVHEERIRNKQVRQHFYNIPKIESFINKRTATYVSKVARSGDEGLPKKLLGAWMHRPRKAGGQQLSCNNNFAHAITAILPDAHLERQGLPFKKWIPLASDEKTWKDYINAYFEACKTTDEEREDNEKMGPNPPGAQTAPHPPAHSTTTRSHLLLKNHVERGTSPIFSILYFQFSELIRLLCRALGIANSNLT